jgi:hypothetical protein
MFFRPEMLVIGRNFVDLVQNQWNYFQPKHIRYIIARIIAR